MPENCLGICNTVWSVAFSPEGNILASGGELPGEAMGY